MAFELTRDQRIFVRSDQRMLGLATWVIRVKANHVAENVRRDAHLPCTSAPTARQTEYMRTYLRGETATSTLARLINSFVQSQSTST